MLEQFILRENESAEQILKKIVETVRSARFEFNEKELTQVVEKYKIRLEENDE